MRQLLPPVALISHPSPQTLTAFAVPAQQQLYRSYIFTAAFTLLVLPPSAHAEGVGKSRPRLGSPAAPCAKGCLPRTTPHNAFRGGGGGGGGSSGCVVPLKGASSAIPALLAPKITRYIKLDDQSSRLHNFDQHIR